MIWVHKINEFQPAAGAKILRFGILCHSERSYFHRILNVFVWECTKIQALVYVKTPIKKTENRLSPQKILEKSLMSPNLERGGEGG